MSVCFQAAAIDQLQAMEKAAMEQANEVSKTMKQLAAEEKQKADEKKRQEDARTERVRRGAHTTDSNRQNSREFQVQLLRWSLSQCH